SKVEHVMGAPKKDFVFRSLEGKTEWDVSAIVLMGTGVGLIHARSITNNPALNGWMAVNELRSEELPADPLVLRRLSESAVTYQVNGGKRHPFVDALQKAYEDYVIGDGGSRITPAYDMDFAAAERIFGVGLEEVADSEFRGKVRSGYFQERVN